MSEDVKGIVLVGKKWRADISVGSIRYQLGYFPTQKKAEQARLEAETAFDDWFKDFKARAKEPIESDEAEAMPIKVKAATILITSFIPFPPLQHQIFWAACIG